MTPSPLAATLATLLANVDAPRSTPAPESAPAAPAVPFDTSPSLDVKTLDYAALAADLTAEDFRTVNHFVFGTLLRTLYRRGYEAIVLDLKHWSHDGVYAVLRLMGGCDVDLSDEGERVYYAEGLALLGDARKAIAADPVIRPLVDALESIWFCEEPDLELELYELCSAWPRFVAAIGQPSDAGCPALDDVSRIFWTLEGIAPIEREACGTCSECTRPC
jgi:hypothetical protein